MRRAYQYRLCPTPTQQERLDWTLDRCRELYNACVQERRDAYRMCGVSVGFYEQKRQLPAIKDARPEYKEIGSQVLQNVVERVDKAFVAFFRRIKARQKAGYPRFKGRDRYDSFTFTQAGWALVEGRLRLGGIGSVKVRWSRPIQGRIKTVTIRRDADHWYASFSCEVDHVAPSAPDKPAIGIDMGLEHFATLSTGKHIANPRHFRGGEALLARRQQSLARKKRGSNRRKKAKLLVAKAHRKVRNQRRDFHHKAANGVVAQAGAIAVESLNTAGMVKNHSLAKSISDAGWAQFLTMLGYKAEGAGVQVIAVNPSGTSQACSACGAVVRKDLSTRWHTCACGASLQRDVNAARIILKRAGLARQAASVA